MALYKYKENLSPQDRFDNLTISLDGGAAVRLEKGNTYDLTDTEVLRARQRVIMVPSTDPLTIPQRAIDLPVIGDLNDGDVPVWDESKGYFVPGVGGGGGGGVSQSYVDTAVANEASNRNAAIATHEADTTSVHGIANTGVLATASSVATAVSTHEADTTAVHGIADTSSLATSSSVSGAVSTHAADQTAVHGVTDFAGIPYVLKWDGTSNYVPASLRTVTERPREFRGPTDPATIGSITLAEYDTWTPTT